MFGRRVKAATHQSKRRAPNCHLIRVLTADLHLPARSAGLPDRHAVLLVPDMKHQASRMLILSVIVSASLPAHLPPAYQRVTRSRTTRCSSGRGSRGSWLR